MKDRDLSRVVEAHLGVVLQQAAPDELDMVADYVANPDPEEAQESLNAPTEVLALVGPVVLNFVVSTAIAFLTKVKEDSVKAAADATMAWLKKKFRGVPETPKLETEAETQERIADAFRRSGKDARTATILAELAMLEAQSMSKRLIVIAGA